MTRKIKSRIKIFLQASLLLVLFLFGVSGLDFFHVNTVKAAGSLSGASCSISNFPSFFNPSNTVGSVDVSFSISGSPTPGYEFGASAGGTATTNSGSWNIDPAPSAGSTLPPSFSGSGPVSSFAGTAVLYEYPVGGGAGVQVDSSPFSCSAPPYTPPGTPLSVSCTASGPTPIGYSDFWGTYAETWDISLNWSFEPYSSPSSSYGTVGVTGPNGGASDSVGTSASGTKVLTYEGPSTGNQITFTAELYPNSGSSITSTCTGTSASVTPVVNLSAAPNPVDYGSSTVLSWTSVYATSCTATQGSGFSTSGGTSGSDTSDNLTADESFTVSCTGPGGTASDSVLVDVLPPPFSCSISNSNIAQGGSIDATAVNGSGSFTWSTPGATSTWGSGAIIGAQYGNAGQFSVDVSTSAGQSAHCGDVTVNPAGPYVNLSASPNPVNYNAATTLSWNSGFVDSCTATQGPGFSTGGATSGSDPSSVLTSATTFTISCTGAGGTATDSVTVLVNGETPACTSSAPEATSTGSTSGTFYVYAYGVTGATAVVFPTWGDTGGQDDIIWYAGTNLGGGTWRASVNLASHKVGSPEYGTINVHIYMSSATVGNTWCGVANFTRNVSPVPDVVLSVNPTSGTYPASTTLSWTTTNAPTSCVASSSTNDWTGSKATAAGPNTESLVPTVGGHTYTIVCTNAYGTDSDTQSYTQNACGGCTTTGSITITPSSPCAITPPATSCSPTPQVSWSTTNTTYAQVLVSQYDPNTATYGPYTLFNSGCAANNPTGLPRSVSASGSVVEQYQFKLYAAADCFTLPGGSLTGTVVLLWDTASGAVPSGWTCISCNVGDPLYGKFPRASDSYGATGGTDTGSHTLTYQSQTAGASQSTGESSSGGFYPTNSHTHTWSNVTSSTDSIIPPYKHLKFISRTNPPSIPAGAIALFDASVPSGWTRYSSLDGTYLRGGPDANTGGSATHTHTFTATSSVDSGALRDTANNTTVATGHSHTIASTALTASSNTPPYIDVIFGQATADTAAPAGMIAFFTGAVPSGWTTVSGSSSSYYQRMLRGSASFGSTGGSATHNHGGSVVGTSGAPGNNNLVRSGFSANGSTSSHTHAVTYTVDSQNSVPAYIDIVLAKYTAFTLLDTEVLTGSLPGPWADLSLSNKDIVSVNGRAVSYNPTDGIAEADIGSASVAEGSPIEFAIHIVNSGTATVGGDFTVVDTLTNLGPPSAGWDDKTVTLNCNGIPCDRGDYVLNSVVYNPTLKQITFAIESQAKAGGLAQNEYLSIVYTAYAKGPTGTTASIFRFSNVARISYTDPVSAAGEEINCDSYPLSCSLRTPLVLFFRGLPVPFLKEVQ